MKGISPLNYLKNFVITVFTISMMLDYTSAFANELDPSCKSNVKLAESAYLVIGLDFENKQSFKKLPAWVSKDVVDIYNRAAQLPVNPSDELIMSVFSQKPEILTIIDLKKFNWEFEVADVEYTLLIKKYKGCLYSTSLFIGPGNNNVNRPSYFFVHNYITPSGYTRAVKKNKNLCQLSRVKEQEYHLSINSLKPKSYNDSIPDHVHTLMYYFGRYNYDRKYLIEKMGPGKLSGAYNTWTSHDGFGRSFQVKAKIPNNCLNVLEIGWMDKNDNKFVFVKINIF